MPATPQINYFESRQGYYTQYKKRQRLLAKGPKDEPDGPTYQAAVKKFAQRMIDDHSKAREKLMDIAKDMKVGVAAGLSREHRELLLRLTKADGANFDRAYMNHMVDDHEKVAKAFEKESKDAKDPDLKAWAAKTLPTLQQHLEMAKNLNGQIKK